MSRYLLNSAVITAEGLYRYTLMQPETARAWFVRGPVISCVRYPESVAALEAVLSLPVGTLAVSDCTIVMEPGDEALCFRPRYLSGVRYSTPQKAATGWTTSEPIMSWASSSAWRRKRHELGATIPETPQGAASRVWGQQGL